jgi:dihydroorotase
MAQTTILRGARVIDPAQGIDKITDVEMTDGKIAAIGDIPDRDGAEVLNLAGSIVSAGWVDLHVHAYGNLGFAHPDYIGIHQGVTSFCEAGGPGLDSFSEYKALMTDATVTDLYCGVYLRGLGIISGAYAEGEIRTLGSIDIPAWIDVVNENRDVLKYMKLGAFGYNDWGVLRMGKGVAEILELPTYTHIGEIYEDPVVDTAGPAFGCAEAGDMVTHIYHRNAGSIFTDDGKIRAEVRAAEKRGVLFDIGFGATNFSFDVAERAMANGIYPHTISSDLQQYNVEGPCFSFANVMSCFLPLGMSLTEIVERITIAPAKWLKIDHRAGSLKVGMPADVTVFELEQGEFEIVDCFSETRKSDQQFKPLMVFKDGVRYECDVEMARDERNWLPIIDEEQVPNAAAGINAAQKKFLQALVPALKKFAWDRDVYNLDLAIAIQNVFHATQREQGISLKDALTGTYQCFLEEPFTYQIGLFLSAIDQSFVLERLDEITALKAAA